MRISFGILTHNEGEYIEQLLQQLIRIKKEDDEIVIVDDYSSDQLTKAILEEHQAEGNIKLYKRELNKDFASQKNFLNSKCSGDWIVNIDADELLSPDLESSLHDLIELNLVPDAIWVPRINIVQGLTAEHIAKWNWKVDVDGHINFPDWQLRIYKNSPEIYWVGRVHEVLNGYKHYSFLPPEKNFCLIHEKMINRQEDQNNFYSNI